LSGGSVDRRDEQILLKNKPFKPAVLYQVADLFGDKIPDRKVGEAKAESIKSEERPLKRQCLEKPGGKAGA